MDIDKETKALIEKILHEIAEDIIERFDKKELKEDIGLLSGKAGISLFMFYNARYFKSEKYEEYAQKILEDVFNDINSGKVFPTYCSGIAGVCWAIIHLVEEGFIEKENLEVLDDFDFYLERAMKTYIENNDYDFLHGATGIANYFTKRAEKKKEIIPFLEYYAQKLSDYAIFDEENKTAKIISTVLDENEKPKEVYNLSMSHGMSSIIIILCKIHNLKISINKCFRLIEGLTNYIIFNRSKIKSINNSLYPSIIQLENNTNKVSKGSRLGWCYGDIGNGFAILNSANKIEYKTEFFKFKAYEIFQNLKLRKDLKLQSINDAGVCHGSAGIVCVMNSLKNIYSDKIFLDLESYWLKITLSYYSKFNNIKGFSKCDINKYIYDVSLLCGTIGVGLTLLQQLKKKLNYETMLLL